MCIRDRYAAESTGGSFTIDSTPGVGTTVTAVFGLSHIDRMPLGDMNGTIAVSYTHLDVYKRQAQYGFVGKTAYDGYPLKVEYYLTERGRKIFELSLIHI